MYRVCISETERSEEFTHEQWHEIVTRGSGGLEPRLKADKPHSLFLILFC